MKNIIKHIVIASVPVALLLTGLTAAAQNYEPGSYKVVGGIAFNKHVTDNHNGTYTVDLESFVTGKIHSETVTVPADILLLMDLSSSMGSNGGYDRTYTEVTPPAMTKVTKDLTPTTKGWIYTDFDNANNTEQGRSFLYNGVYYPVFAVRDPNNTPNRGYQMYIWLPVGNTYQMRYIYGEGSGAEVLHETRNPNPPTGTGGVMWNGTLYGGGWHYSDFTTAPTNTARNYFYYDEVKKEYYPVLYKMVQVGDVNTYQAYVPLPGGDKYLMSDGELALDPYGHFEQYNMLYFGDLYRNGGWTSTSITSGTATTGHYYKHTDGKYYAVTKGVNTSQATVIIHNVTYYLHGSTISTEPYPVPATDADCSIYFNSLYQVASYSGYTRAEGLRRAVTAFITAFSEKSIEQGLHHRLGMLEYCTNQWYPKTSGTGDINSPVLTEVPMDDAKYTHLVKDLLDVTDATNEAILSDAVVMPTSFIAESYLSYGLSLANAVFDKARANPIDENGDGIVDEYKRPQIAIIIGDGGAAGSQEGPQATALYEDGVTVFFVHVAPGDYGVANVRTVLANSHPDLGSSYYASYTTANYNAGRRWEFLTKVNDYDETLIDEIISITDDIGGTDLEVEGTVVTVDVVSQAFNIPTGDEVSAPKVYVAPLTGKMDGTSWDPAPTVSGGDDEFVYYTFGDEVLQGEGSGITLTEGVDEYGNKKLSVEGFDYSAHWCGPDNKNTSGGYHADGQKLILRFTVVPNEDAVGGPEVQTNTDGSGIWIPDPDNPGQKKQIAKFNQPTVSLPVNLWIEKQGLEGDDSAVFTIYYADPSKYRAGTDPHDMTYESFTKVIVHATDLDENGRTMVKITGLDSKFYYRIKEDAWAWSYDYQTSTQTSTDIEVGVKYSSDVIQNPIQFVNEKNTNVKHAESVVTNVFSVKSE